MYHIGASPAIRNYKQITNGIRMVLRKEFVLMFWFIIIYSFVGRGLFERNTKGSPSGMLTSWWLITVHGCRQWFYPGAGTGWQDRSTQRWKKKEVIVTFWRESNQGSVRPGVRVTEKSDRDNEKSVRPGDRPGVRAKAVLTGKELDIVNYCTVPRTSKEILARVGVSYHSKNLAKYVKSLVSKGFLKMTIPDKPNDPNQKYVKV